MQMILRWCVLVVMAAGACAGGVEAQATWNVGTWATALVGAPAGSLGKIGYDAAASGACVDWRRGHDVRDADQ